MDSDAVVYDFHKDLIQHMTGNNIFKYGSADSTIIFDDDSPFTNNPCSGIFVLQNSVRKRPVSRRMLRAWWRSHSNSKYNKIFPYEQKVTQYVDQWEDRFGEGSIGIFRHDSFYFDINRVKTYDYDRMIQLESPDAISDLHFVRHMTGTKRARSFRVPFFMDYLHKNRGLRDADILRTIEEIQSKHTIYISQTYMETLARELVE